MVTLVVEVQIILNLQPVTYLCAEGLEVIASSRIHNIKSVFGLAVKRWQSPIGSGPSKEFN